MSWLTASIVMVDSIASVKMDMKVQVPIAVTSTNVQEDLIIAAQMVHVSTTQVTSLVNAMMDTQVMASPAMTSTNVLLELITAM